jgi:hypothetical protein
MAPEGLTATGMKQTSAMIIDNNLGNEQHYTPESGIRATGRPSQTRPAVIRKPASRPPPALADQESESPADGGASNE